MPEIVGIPDKSIPSDPTKLQKGLIDLIVHLHEAERAGKHFDIRLGGSDGLHSFATKKGLPTPGNKVQLFPQPLHSKEYGDFEGTIPEGYGKGKVSIHEKGKAFITNVSKDKINLTIGNSKYPERFTMVRMKDDSWLLMNTTPQEPFSTHKKMRFKRVEADDVEKLFTPERIQTAKIDGSAAIYDLVNDKLEISSYRTTKQGKPIIHTERVLQDDAGRHLKLPKHLQGSVLRGEIYGTKDNKAITAQQLGGILNSTLTNSLQKQKEQNVNLQNLVYAIYRYGNKPVGVNVPYDKRMKMIKEILPYLPKNRFSLPIEAREPEAQRKMWTDITSGKNPLTSEGIVSWPQTGKPTKVKTYPEFDVYIRKMLEGDKKLKGKGVGAFGYSLTPDGEIVGNVGTGFDDSTREDMYLNPDNYIGRVARIRAQEQFPSGAYRAPAFLALHEDYPMKSAGLRGFQFEGSKGVINGVSRPVPSSPGPIVNITGSNISGLPPARYPIVRDIVNENIKEIPYGSRQRALEVNYLTGQQTVPWRPWTGGTWSLRKNRVMSADLGNIQTLQHELGHATNDAVMIASGQKLPRPYSSDHDKLITELPAEINAIRNIPNTYEMQRYLSNAPNATSAFKIWNKTLGYNSAPEYVNNTLTLAKLYQHLLSKGGAKITQEQLKEILARGVKPDKFVPDSVRQRYFTNLFNESIEPIKPTGSLLGGIKDRFSNLTANVYYPAALWAGRYRGYVPPPGVARAAPNLNLKQKFDSLIDDIAFFNNKVFVRD